MTKTKSQIIKEIKKWSATFQIELSKEAWEYLEERLKQAHQAGRESGLEELKDAVKHSTLSKDEKNAVLLFASLKLKENLI